MANPAVASDAALALTLTRVLEAPPEAVFRAWTDPARLATWFGPKTHRAEVKLLEPRPNGAIRIAMTGPEGQRLRSLDGKFRELVPPRRLVISWILEDPNTGQRTAESLLTVTFRAVPKGTELTLRHEGFESVDLRDRHNQGWLSSLERLPAALAQA